jgi:hypothetical protein
MTFKVIRLGIYYLHIPTHPIILVRSTILARSIMLARSTILARSIMLARPTMLALCGCVAVWHFCQALQDARRPARTGSRAGFDGPGV